ICLMADLPFRLICVTANHCSDAIGFWTVILRMMPVCHEYLGWPPHGGAPLPPAIVRSEVLLRLLARGVEHHPEHIKGLDPHLTHGRWIESNFNDIAGGRCLLPSVDIDIDAVVAGGADQTDGQSSARNDHRLVRLDIIRVLRGDD